MAVALETGIVANVGSEDYQEPETAYAGEKETRECTELSAPPPFKKARQHFQVMKAQHAEKQVDHGHTAEVLTKEDKKINSHHYYMTIFEVGAS